MNKRADWMSWVLHVIFGVAVGALAGLVSQEKLSFLQTKSMIADS